MDRHVVIFQDYLPDKAVDKLNGYCCNTDNQPIQLEVISKPGVTIIIAIVEKHELIY